MNDTIIAISTPPGIGALGIIRVSGDRAIHTVNAIFSKSILKAKGYTLHYGRVLDKAEIIDEVIVSIFRAPSSFTKEDVVEISVMGVPIYWKR